jgi:hypothetical protein
MTQNVFRPLDMGGVKFLLKNRQFQYSRYCTIGRFYRYKYCTVLAEAERSKL